MEVKIDEYYELNGARQFVSIRAAQEELPLLLYLHGGPGDAALPLVRKYNRALEHDFTVVVWEQRGAGKSYYPFGSTEPVEISTYLQDLYVLIQMLLNKFCQEKVYLVGHSWGSVLGLRFCQLYPALVRAYVGCGQVVDMKKGCQRAYEFAVEHAVGRARARLAGIDCAYTGQNWLSDLLFVTRQVVRHKGSLYGAGNYNRFVRDFICAKEYGLRDLLCREKGGLQSIRALWQELMQVSFEGVHSFEVPVVFVEGRYDAHVSSALVWDFFEGITSPKAFHWFERSCHFPQWSEPEHFREVLLELGGRA